MSNNFKSLDETATALGISSDELIEMRSRGEIFGYHEGSSWKFTLEEVERVKHELDTIAEETRRNLERALENTTPNIAFTGDSYKQAPDDEIIEAEFEPKTVVGHSTEKVDSATQGRVEEFLKLQGELKEDGTSHEGSNEDDVIDLGDEHRNSDLSDSDIFADSDLDLGEESQNTNNPNQSMAQGNTDDEDDLVLDPNDFSLGINDDLNLTNKELQIDHDTSDLRYDGGLDGNSINTPTIPTPKGSDFELASLDDDDDSRVNLDANDSGISLEPPDSGINLEADGSGIGLNADDSGIGLDTPDSDEDNKNEIEVIEVEEIIFDDLDDNGDSSNSDININFIDPARYYSLEDAARYLGIHTSKLRDLREDGQIRGFLEADTLEFRGSDLIELKNKRDDKPFFSEPDQDAEDVEPVAIELEDKDAFNVKSNSSSTDAVDELMLNDQDFLDAAIATSQNSNSTRSIKEDEEDVTDDKDEEDVTDDKDDEEDVTDDKEDEEDVTDDKEDVTDDKDDEEDEDDEENEPTPPATSLPRRIWGTVTNLFSKKRKRVKVNIKKALDIDTKAIISHVLLPTETTYTDINDLRKKMVNKKKTDLVTISDPTEKMEIAQAIDNFNALFIEITSLQTLRKNLGKTSMTSKEQADVKQALVRLNTAIHHAVFTFSDYLDPIVPPALDKQEEADILLPRMDWIIATLKNMNDNNLSYLLGQSVNKNGTVQEEYVESFLQKAQKALADYKKSLKK